MIIKIITCSLTINTEFLQTSSPHSVNQINCLIPNLLNTRSEKILSFTFFLCPRISMCIHKLFYLVLRKKKNYELERQMFNYLCLELKNRGLDRLKSAAPERKQRIIFSTDVVKDLFFCVSWQTTTIYNYISSINHFWSITITIKHCYTCR